MTLSAGDYELGPDNARLVVTTGRQGAAAKAGHDLVLEVMQWEATLKVAAHAAACSLALTVDAASLEVVGASGGMKPLTDKDKADIRTTIDKQVLKRQAIEFRSTAISGADGGLTVKGLLGLRGEERPVSFVISSDGAMITGGLRIDQRDWGIKPFSALLGALRVDAYVTVEVQSTAALLSSAAANRVATAPAENVREATGQTQFSTAADNGTAESALELGDRMREQGDIDGAQTAYERAEAEGSVHATLRLAALMEDHRKDLNGAEAAWRRADEAGSVNGAGNLGRLLKDKGDLRGAEAAFRRCVDRGGVRAAIDYAGLVSLRSDASPHEVAEAVAVLCPAIDGFVLNEDGMLMAAQLVFDGIEERCDGAAIEAGLRLADARGSSSAAYHYAFGLWSRGQRSEAVAAYYRSAQRGFDEAWAKAVGGYLELGDVSSAEAVAREGDQAGVAIASTMLGTVLDQKGDTDGGLKAYRRADERGDGNGSFNLGIELRNRGDLRGAEAALQRATERGAGNAEAALQQVRRRIGSQPPEAASARLAGESLWSWGVRLERMGDISGAAIAYVRARDAAEEPQEPKAILRCAEYLESQNDAGAEAMFIRIADASDAEVKANAWRGIARYRVERGEIDDGLAALQVVVDTGDADEAPRALRNIGSIREDDLGDTEGARSAYHAAIAFDHPQHSPGARVNLAQLLDRTGDHAGAALLFREVIDSGHDREAPRARVLLGLMLEEHGDKEQALQLWESAIECSDPEWSPRAAMNAGAAYLEREQFQQAARLFRIASEHPEQAATAYYFIGLSEGRQGNTQSAAQALRRTADLDSGELRAEALRLLSNLR